MTRPCFCWTEYSSVDHREKLMADSGESNSDSNSKSLGNNTDFNITTACLQQNANQVVKKNTNPFPL